MAFAHNLSRFVSANVRLRGEEYFKNGAVDLIEADGWHVEAEVSGTEQCDVSLEHARGRTWWRRAPAPTS